MPAWAAELIDSDIIEPNEALDTIKNEHRGPYFEILGPILLDRGVAAFEIVSMLEFGVCDGLDSERWGIYRVLRATRRQRRPTAGRQRSHRF